MSYIQPDVNVQRGFPSSPLSEVPVVHLQVAEARLQTGHPRRRVLRLRVPRAGDGRDGKQQLRQRLRRPAFDLRANVAFTPNNGAFVFNAVRATPHTCLKKGCPARVAADGLEVKNKGGLSHPNTAAAA